MKPIFFAAIILTLVSVKLSAETEAAGKLKNFRGTSQTLALLGLVTEFVDQATEDRITSLTRKAINRYSNSYGEQSVSTFKLGRNPSKQYLKPSESGSLSGDQKKFLADAAKANSVTILVLGSLRSDGDQLTYRLQLFDSRTETLSGIEKAQFSSNPTPFQIESLVFKIMNYMDKDGYVQPTSLDLLETPSTLTSQSRTNILKGAEKDEFSINPSDLSSGHLAGPASIGGEKTPFWETWWFWTLVGAGLAGGGLTFYLVNANQDPASATVHFKLN